MARRPMPSESRDLPRIRLLVDFSLAFGQCWWVDRGGRWWTESEGSRICLACGRTLLLSYADSGYFARPATWEPLSELAIVTSSCNSSLPALLPCPRSPLSVHRQGWCLLSQLFP